MNLLSILLLWGVAEDTEDVVSGQVKIEHNHKISARFPSFWFNQLMESPSSARCEHNMKMVKCHHVGSVMEDDGRCDMPKTGRGWGMATYSVDFSKLYWVFSALCDCRNSPEIPPYGALAWLRFKTQRKLFWLFSYIYYYILYNYIHVVVFLAM